MQKRLPEHTGTKAKCPISLWNCFAKNLFFFHRHVHIFTPCEPASGITDGNILSFVQRFIIFCFLIVRCLIVLLKTIFLFHFTTNSLQRYFVEQFNKKLFVNRVIMYVLTYFIAGFEIKPKRLF